MTALAMERATREDRWTHQVFPLATGKKAWKGGAAAIDTATGYVVPAVTGTGLVFIGKFDETIDNTDGSVPVQISVNLIREVVLHWFANAGGGDAVAASDIGQDAYLLDDQTVTITSTGRSKAGRIWAVDAARGVAVEVL